MSGSEAISNLTSAPSRETSSEHLRRERNIHVLQPLHKARANARRHNAANHLALAHALVLEHE